jgi:outer membrane immunogenic protein
MASWTGFYLNAGLGYGMWTADTTTLIPAGFAGAGTCFLCVTQTQGGKGWLATVGGGFDYQFTDRIVAGVLADFDFGSLKGTVQDQLFFLAGTIKQTSAWSAGARIGWLVTPATLTYFNGGYSQTRFSSADMVFTFNGAAAGVSTPSFTHGGWFIGGGVEAMLSPGWFWRSEYRYADYGTTTLTDRNGPAVGSDITFHPVVQTVRSEVVYKFNWLR